MQSRAESGKIRRLLQESVPAQGTAEGATSPGIAQAKGLQESGFSPQNLESGAQDAPTEGANGATPENLRCRDRGV